jgi:hypothetical protein
LFARHSALADLESIKMELMDKEQEIVEVRHEATVAAERAWEVEQTMEKVVSELKEEVMSATGNMQGAALAGLGLQVGPPPPPPPPEAGYNPTTESYCYNT